VTRRVGQIAIEWHPAEFDEFCRNPRGPLGRDLMDVIGAGITERAKAKALRRTGRMADEIHYEVSADEISMYADIISPAVNPQTGFPYPVTHEARKVRDRRPHRSLKPALDEIQDVIG
jgi:hypothetical protein